MSKTKPESVKALILRLDSQKRKTEDSKEITEIQGLINQLEARPSKRWAYGEISTIANGYILNKDLVGLRRFLTSCKNHRVAYPTLMDKLLKNQK